MRSPGFWYPSESGPTIGERVARWLLSPVAAVYAAGAGIKRRMTAPERPSVPVICVGNFTAGGAGKTPIALSVAAHLQRMAETPHFLSRGYGGTETGPVQVKPGTHRSDQVGDEPLLLANLAPAWVAKDRPAGAFAAEAAGASVIVMDDGFQNPSLHKDLSLIVVDAGVGIGNGAVLPAGPLREPLSTAIVRADAIVLLGDGAKAADVSALARDHNVPCLRARLQPDADSAALAGKDCIAFAGIGRPEKFFETVAEAGGNLVGRHAFADHAPLSDADARSLLTEARDKNALLVTTAKDHARLVHISSGPVSDLKDQLVVLRVTAQFEDENALETLLGEHLTAARASHTYAPPGTRRDET